MKLVKEQILILQLSIIKEFDDRISIINNFYEKTKSEVGSFLNYNIISDEEIELNYGFNSYEEHDINNCKMIFEESKIIVNIENSGYSVYINEYNNKDEITFNNLYTFLDWLNSEISQL